MLRGLLGERATGRLTPAAEGGLWVMLGWCGGAKLGVLVQCGKSIACHKGPTRKSSDSASASMAEIASATSGLASTSGRRDYGRWWCWQRAQGASHPDQLRAAVRWYVIRFPGLYMIGFRSPFPFLLAAH